MKKVLLSTIAGMALLLGAEKSAFAGDGLGIGVTVAGTRISASGTETEGTMTAAGETNSTSVNNSLFLGSIFAEYTHGWLTVGVEHIPGDASVSDLTHTRNDTETSVTSTTTETTTARTQTAAAKVDGHNTAYLEVGNAAYFKAGYVEMTVQTDESLGTGSTYGNVDLNGVLIGLGYKGDFGDGGFYKIEGTYTDYDSLSITSGTARTGVTNNNKVTADLDVSQLKLGLGYRF